MAENLWTDINFQLERFADKRKAGREEGCERVSTACYQLRHPDACIIAAIVGAEAIAAMDFQLQSSDHHESTSTVSLPSLNPTVSFWLHLPPEDSPFANVGSTGFLTEDADICVIGSGITGVGVVWHLVKDLQRSLKDGAKMKIVLLEARQFCKDITSINMGGQQLSFYFIQVQELLVISSSVLQIVIYLLLLFTQIRTKRWSSNSTPLLSLSLQREDLWED